MSALLVEVAVSREMKKPILTEAMIVLTGQNDVCSAVKRVALSESNEFRVFGVSKRLLETRHVSSSMNAR